MTDKKLADEEGRLASLARLAVLEDRGDGAFPQITQVVRTALDLPIAAVTLIEADTQFIRAGRGVDLTETPRSSSFCTFTIQEREPLVVEDALERVPFNSIEYVTGEPFIRSYVGVPLATMDGYQVGALCGMDTRPRSFSPAQIMLMSQLARCVENEMELTMRVALDGLTQVLNRSAFLAAAETMRAKAAGGPVSLAMLDLDRFKSINDTFGHAEGDNVLKFTAGLLRAVLGGAVRVGRLGGEEFGVLFAGRTPEEAAVELDRFRMAMAEQRIIGGSSRVVTVSIGVTEVRPQVDEPDITTPFRRADIALYAAKTGGRDRVVVWTPEARMPAREDLALPTLRPLVGGLPDLDPHGSPQEIVARLKRRTGGR